MISPTFCYVSLGAVGESQGGWIFASILGGLAHGFVHLGGFGTWFVRPVFFLILIKELRL
jgi:hypothetical protein